MKYLVLPVLAIMLCSTIYVSAAPPDPQDFINQTIQVLQKYAVYDVNGTLLGWDFRINSSLADAGYYPFGYSIGVTGIGDFLLSAYQAGYTAAKPLLDDVLQEVRIRAIVTPTGTYWNRYVGIISDGWSGIRHGMAGVLTFLGNVQASGYTDVNDLIVGGYQWLMHNKATDGGWDIEKDSYSTTGIEYGMAGIAQAMLQLGQQLHNSTYTNEALAVGDWLLAKGTWSSSTFMVPWTLYGNGTIWDNRYIAGFSVGEAGIAQVMLDLYRQSNETKYLDAGLGLVNHLLQRDKGGYWDDGSVTYVTEIYINQNGFTGLYSGSAGIALLLLDAYSLRANDTYYSHAATAERYVNSLTYANGSVSLTNIAPDYFFTGYAHGAAGVAWYEMQLYEKFGNARNLDITNAILSHLQDLASTNGLVPIATNEPEFGRSFNLEQGIAGIAKVFLEYKILTSGMPNSKYNSIYSTATVVTSASSTSTTPVTWFTLALIPTYFIYYRRSHQQ